MGTSFRRALGALAIAPVLALGACDSSSSILPISKGQKVAVVVNSVNRTLTVQPTDAGTATHTIGLGSQGSPVTVAVRGNRAVVPMGTYPFAAVVDLATDSVKMVALPAGSGATGVAFLNDSIAVVANSNLNTVTPVNVLRRTAGASVAVGRYPQAVVSDGNRVYVVNAELVNFAPAGHGTVTVLDRTLAKVGTVQLGGDNSAAGAVLDNRLYVVNSGSYGANDGSLSVVDLTTLGEVRLATGFGNFPGAIAAGPDHRLYVGVFGTGVLVWNPTGATFVNDAAHPVLPGGGAVVSALGFDDQGRLFTLDPGECKDPGHLLQVSVTGTVQTSFATGMCPFALAFTSVTYPNN